MTQATDARRSPRLPAVKGFMIATAVGMLLGAVGPFGSYLNGPLPSRAAYWVGSLWLGWLAIGVTVPPLATWTRAHRLSPWLWAPPAVAVLNVPPALLSRALAMQLWPVVRRVGWLEWYGQSLVISAVATVGVLWAMRTRTAAAPARSGPADPRDRLPRHLGRTVLCLQMEDHYVRVHTSEGSALVLTSLSQAIAGLGDQEGAQTHRSWWVARAAVTGVIEDGRNMRLRLANGLEAPISRARLGSLREVGWLASFPPPSR